MKVYINNYKNHWISPYTICEKVCFWREIEYDEPWVKRTSDVLYPVMVFVQRVWDFFGRKINYVKIDPWDTWSMDHTLAHIILPMLKQLQSTKHGAPLVDDEDVPDDLKSTSVPQVEEGDTDSNFFMRWDWVLNEMIWSFEQKLMDDNDDQFFDHTDAKGLPWEDDYIGPKWNKEGYEAHHNRMKNGFRLFGKYYQNLWD